MSSKTLVVKKKKKNLFGFIRSLSFSFELIQGNLLDSTSALNVVERDVCFENDVSKIFAISRKSIVCVSNLHRFIAISEPVAKTNGSHKCFISRLPSFLKR